MKVDYSIAEIIYGLFAVILAVGFVAIMSVSAVKYYMNKNESLTTSKPHITNDMVIYLADNAHVERNGDTIRITLHNPFNDFKWSKTEVINHNYD